jgi:hypothetical protein
MGKLFDTATRYSFEASQCPARKAEQPPFLWRTYLFAALAITMSLSAVTTTRADTYPSKTITIVVGLRRAGSSM